MYLEHYGVVGMKWYQHKYGEVDGRAKYDDKYKRKEIKKVQRSTKVSAKIHSIFDSPENVKIIREQGKKECAKILSYSHNDIVNEVNAVNKRIGESVTTSLMTGFAPESISKFKESYRTGTTTKYELAKKRMGV